MPDHLALSRPTRRAFLTGSLAATAAVVLAACGGDDDDTTTAATGAAPASTSATSAARTSAGASAFPATVEGALGAITVERSPERVVTVGYLRDTDIAVALGIDPVGVADPGLFDGGIAPWVAEALAGRAQPTILAGQTVNFEEVAGLRPDLILATDSFTLADDYPELSAIAPTLSYKTGRNDDSWQTMATHIGPALGKTAEAEALVAGVQDQLATARRDHPELEGKTFTFGPVQPDGKIFMISSTDDASAGLLAELGLVLAPSVTALPEGNIPNRAEVSPERLDLIDADAVLLVFPTDEVRATFEAGPLFEQQPFVQRGGYSPLDFSTALAFAFPSVLSIPYGPRQTLPRLVAAVS